jgi:hypothetical protein
MAAALAPLGLAGAFIRPVGLVEGKQILAVSNGSVKTRFPLDFRVAACDNRAWVARRCLGAAVDPLLCQTDRRAVLALSVRDMLAGPQYAESPVS